MNSTRLNFFILKILLAAFLSAAGMLLCISGPVTAGDSKAGKDRVNFRHLEGRWVRPDGGYVIELRDIKKDGSVSAAYFNPKPIRVYRAETMKKNGKISLFVELRDVNYPGSTYNLIYDSATDRLKGTYFQAVHKQTFKVEFMRSR
jgi:hypothetical protein